MGIAMVKPCGSPPKRRPLPARPSWIVIAGAELTVTTETVFQVFSGRGRRKRLGLGPVAFTYEVLALRGPEIAAEFAYILNEW